MSISGITINGQYYESPEAMPPDARLLYEEALRAIGPSLAGGKGSNTTQVVTSHSGLGMSSHIVINKTITVNDKTYKSVDEMPPEVRSRVES